MKRGMVRLLVLAAGPFCALALVAPAGAAGGPSALPTAPAWLKWSPPAVPKAAPSALAGFFSSAGGSSTSYNSSGGPVVASSSGTGAYTVTFTGLGGITGGNVEVTSEGTDTCSVEEWGVVSGDLAVNVDCYDYTGAAANAEFSLVVTQPFKAPSHGALAYDWIYNATGSYTLKATYQYNSAHRKNKVAHLGTGRYKVTMAGVGGTGASGTVKVSAYGAGAGDCQLAQWSGTSARTEVIYVDCYAANGARANRQFDVVYAKKTNLMGQNGLATGNALADRPGVSAYIPAIQYLSDKGAKVDLSTFDLPKVYLVLFSGLRLNPSLVNGGGGDVQVTAQGSHYAHCFAFLWGAQARVTPYAEVACLNNHQHLVNSKFTIQWASAR